MAEIRALAAVWTDATGRFTARLCAEDAEHVGQGDTAAEAVLQIRETLHEALREEAPPEAPRRAKGPRPRPTAAETMLDPDHADIITVRVDVRTVERAGDREFPADTSVMLRMPAVAGRTHGGSLGLCVLPTIGLTFHYLPADRAKLRGLIEHRIREALFGKSAEELVALLPPPGIETTTLTVTIPRTRASESDQDEPAITAIADPLFRRSGSGKSGRTLFRDEIIADVVACLRTRVSVVLVGPTGAGKTAVLKAAAGHAVTDDATRRRRFWSSDASRIIAGMRYLGQWEERLEQALNALADQHGVLCFPDLVSLLRTGGSAPESSVAAFMLASLRAGRLCVVGESPPEAWDACRREYPAFAAEFRVVRVPALNGAQTKEVLDATAQGYASGFHLEVQPGTTRLLLDLHERFAPYRGFPGAPASFLQRLFDRVTRDQPGTLDKETVFAQFAEENGLGRELLDDSVTLERPTLEAFFHTRVLGQSAACAAASNIVTRLKSGLNDPERPLGVLLFAGPTGVGKTELAKTLAQRLFGAAHARERLVRLDMSEYQAPGSVDRLIGTYELEPPAWLRTVRRFSCSVVLFDEIEKAAPDVFDLFLALFDEGRLADRYGRLTWFRSTVIVMTTNLGARSTAAPGFHPDDSPDFEKAIRGFFRPEFINRIDQIVAFNSLDTATAHALVAKELTALGEREGIQRRNLVVQADTPLIAHLAEQGFDDRLGARPLQRVIEDLVAAPLARHLLAQPAIKNGTLRMRWSGGATVFSWDE